MKKVILLVALSVVLTGCAQNVENSTVTQQNNEDRFAPNPMENSKTQTTATNEDLTINQDNQMSNQAQSTEGNLVLIKTSLGDIRAKLYTEESPISTENFKQYVNNKFYDGTIFHRIIPGFMIQGGGFDEKGIEKTTLAPIKNEAKNGLSNKRGTLAMARTMVTDSATSQFYINLVDNTSLDYRNDNNYGYAVFGEVIEGLDVVDKIAQVQTGDHGMYQDWPVDNVVIKSIEMVE